LGALNRELKDELNYSLENEPKLFDVWNYISKNGRRHSVFIDYICQFKKKPKFSSPEKLKILWLTKRELMNIIKNKEFIKRIFNFKF